MSDQHFAREPQPVRYPLDPITISDGYALIAITVGAMLNETTAELYLIDLIDNQAHVLHEDLGKEMIRPVLTPEEYKALYAHHQ